MTIISPKVPLAILESYPSLSTLISELKDLVEQVVEYAETTRPAIEADGKKFLGVHYSASLFEGSNDNIFYQVHVGEMPDKKDFFAEVRFYHSGTQLNTGLTVAPADVQAPGTDRGLYSFSCLNNITFPRFLTHLLYQAMTKLLSELTAAHGDFSTLAEVAVLITTHDTFR